MKWRKTANSREEMPEYMERKGSGFGKIISGYEFQINYNESKRPSFRSDRYQFTVVMPNLNYDVPQDVPQDKLDVQIMDLIRKDRKISTEKIAIALGVSSKTIKRHIKEMDNVNYIGASTFEEIGTQKYPIYTQGTICVERNNWGLGYGLAPVSF